MNFWVADSDYYHPPIWANPTPITEPGVASIEIGGALLPDGSGGYTADMMIYVIPEPTTLTLLSLGSLALVMARRRR
jgi:hypothetical protein